MASLSLELPVTPSRWALLISFALAAVAMIAMDGTGHAGFIWVGAAAWAVCAVLVCRDPEPKLRRRMAVLLGCIAVLTGCDIHTTVDERNLWQVGIPFALVIFVPALLQHWGDRGVIRFRFWPVQWHLRDVIYTIVAVPLAWLVLQFYWWCNPDLFRHWELPSHPEQSAIQRLFLAINAVGVWDELFFVNTVFAMLRSLFPYKMANAVQAVVYASVLYDMAFTGIGPIILLAFAWTQGAMFERSENLLFVLIVHLVVDFFLVAAIVSSSYPGYGFDYLWRHGF